MKILRLQHNLETIINADFLAVGVGVDYINFPTQGIPNKDTAKLYLSEDIWLDVPLKCFDVLDKHTKTPYGWQFSRPFLFTKGMKAKFQTNQSVDKDGVHLLFYGHYLTSQESLQIQKKPLSKIFITGFDITEQTQKFILPFPYLLLSIGILYGYKPPSEPEKYWTAMPSTIKGYLDIRERNYYFDDNQFRSLNLLSDLYLGRRSVCNQYNLWGIRVEGNEHIRLSLQNPLNAPNESLYIVFEYVKMTAEGMILPLETASVKPGKEYQIVPPKSVPTKEETIIPKSVRRITKFSPLTEKTKSIE